MVFTPPSVPPFAGGQKPSLPLKKDFFESLRLPFQRELHLSHQASLPSGTRGCNRPPVLGTATL